MAPINEDEIIGVLDNGPHRSLDVRKHLTLAFSGVYIASTTVHSNPKLIWESENLRAVRYYVPVASLHNDIQAAIGSEISTNETTNGHSKSHMQLEMVKSISSKASDSKAVVERLTIGSRSTTWVRFQSSPLKDFIRFERDEIDDWFENGAFFAGLRNPFKRIETSPVAANVIVKVDGEVIAESTVAVLLSETGLKEAYYLPVTSIKDWGTVSKSDWRTQCPYKGEAWYLNLSVNGQKYDNAIWYYMYPTHESAGIEGLISFHLKDNVDLLVDGAKV